MLLDVFVCCLLFFVVFVAVVLVFWGISRILIGRMSITVIKTRYRNKCGPQMLQVALILISGANIFMENWYLYTLNELMSELSLSDWNQSTCLFDDKQAYTLLVFFFSFFFSFQCFAFAISCSIEVNDEEAVKVYSVPIEALHKQFLK